jgi:hypothetical protein
MGALTKIALKVEGDRFGIRRARASWKPDRQRS